MKYLLLIPVGLVAGCSMIDGMNQTEPDVAPPKVEAPPPPADARTIEDFDTTTEADRVAATAAGSGGRFLGQTVASLGDPGQPGFWMMTPLVDKETPGRLEFPARGTSVDVTLMPSDGASSRVSLAALRLLEAPLGDLSELRVYAE